MTITRHQLLTMFGGGRKEIEQRIAAGPDDPRNQELLNFIARCEDELTKQALQEIADAAAKEIAELWWIHPVQGTPQKQAAIAEIVLKHFREST